MERLTEGELRAQLAICIEFHEEIASGFSDLYDIKGMLTRRKRQLRRQIREAQRVSPETN